MPLKTYNTLDAIPEDERDEYVEHEGKWQPKAVVALAIERSKRARLLGEKKDAERRVRAAQRERDELWATITEQSRQQHEREMTELAAKHQQELAAMHATIRKNSVRDRVTTLLGASGVMGDRLQDAAELAAKSVGIGAHGGLIVLDAKGQATTEDMGAFVKRFRAKHPYLFAGTGASGSGASGSW